MSFIELTRHGDEGEGVTINVDHILTISTVVYEREVCTEIALAGGSPHAPARALVTESYAEVRKLIGLEVAE